MNILLGTLIRRWLSALAAVVLLSAVGTTAKARSTCKSSWKMGIKVKDTALQRARKAQRAFKKVERQLKAAGEDGAVGRYGAARRKITTAERTLKVGLRDVKAARAGFDRAVDHWIRAAASCTGSQRRNARANGDIAVENGDKARSHLREARKYKRDFAEMRAKMARHERLSKNEKRRRKRRRKGPEATAPSYKNVSRSPLAAATSPKKNASQCKRSRRRFIKRNRQRSRLGAKIAKELRGMRALQKRANQAIAKRAACRDAHLEVLGDRLQSLSKLVMRRNGMRRGLTSALASIDKHCVAVDTKISRQQLAKARRGHQQAARKLLFDLDRAKAAMQQACDAPDKLRPLALHTLRGAPATGFALVRGDVWPDQKVPAKVDHQLLAKAFNAIGSRKVAQARKHLNALLTEHMSSPLLGYARNLRGLVIYVEGNYQAAVREWTKTLAESGPGKRGDRVAHRRERIRANALVAGYYARKKQKAKARLHLNAMRRDLAASSSPRKAAFVTYADDLDAALSAPAN